MPETIINATENEEHDNGLTLVSVSVEESASDLNDMAKWPSGILMGD
jgi:hypothetical protein